MVRGNSVASQLPPVRLPNTSKDLLSSDGASVLAWLFYESQLTSQRLCLQKAAGYGAIKLVQMKGADSDWMGMINKYGQAWEVPVTPKLPWDFRIVSDDGQEVRNISNPQSPAAADSAEKCRYIVALSPWPGARSSYSATSLRQACRAAAIRSDVLWHW